MVYITKRLKFSASHRLYSPELTEIENKLTYGKCGDSCTHGHNYILEITVSGEINESTGMILNIIELKKIVMDRIIQRIDHKFINNDVPFLAGVIPTLENLVIEFWKMVNSHIPNNCNLYKIKLYETENNFAEYFGQ